MIFPMERIWRVGAMSCVILAALSGCVKFEFIEHNADACDAVDEFASDGRGLLTLRERPDDANYEDVPEAAFVSHRSFSDCPHAYLIGPPVSDPSQDIVLYARKLSDGKYAGHFVIPQPRQDEPEGVIYKGHHAFLLFGQGTMAVIPEIEGDQPALMAQRIAPAMAAAYRDEAQSADVSEEMAAQFAQLSNAQLEVLVTQMMREGDFGGLTPLPIPTETVASAVADYLATDLRRSTTLVYDLTY